MAKFSKGMMVCGLIFMASLFMFFLYNSLQNRRDKVHFISNLKKKFSNWNFSYSTMKPVSDFYEAGHFIANANLCPDSGKHMKLMILVTSALDRRDARMAIRQTWRFYSLHHNVGVGFIVGSYEQSSQNAIIQEEQQKYGDLIQSRSVDSYSNLTLKTVSILEWVDTYCSQVPFVLKTDDDMFINIPLLLTQLEKQQRAKRSMFGEVRQGSRADRNVASKYFINKTEFEPDFYPVYIMGAAYVMTQDLVHDLYYQALTMPYLKFEDVFITGYAAASIGVRLIHVKEYRNLEMPFSITKIRETISIHFVTPSKQFLLLALVIFENEQTNDSYLGNQSFQRICKLNP